jgi:hypothetical protein
MHWFSANISFFRHAKNFSSETEKHNILLPFPYLRGSNVKGLATPRLRPFSQS